MGFSNKIHLSLMKLTGLRSTGKPYSVALNEDIAEVAGTLKYYGGYADKLHGQVIDTNPAKFAYTIREPLGVCGQIIP